uniref:Uncharacterized protein n=1 Tax=Anopheles farauti TaxID=69004 RepID=A0A182R095_9DIPT
MLERMKPPAPVACLPGNFESEASGSLAIVGVFLVSARVLNRRSLRVAATLKLPSLEDGRHLDLLLLLLLLIMITMPRAAASMVIALVRVHPGGGGRFTAHRIVVPLVVMVVARISDGTCDMRISKLSAKTSYLKRPKPADVRQTSRSDNPNPQIDRIKITRTRIRTPTIEFNHRVLLRDVKPSAKIGIILLTVILDADEREQKVISGVDDFKSEICERFVFVAVRERGVELYQTVAKLSRHLVEC